MDQPSSRMTKPWATYRREIVHLYIQDGLKLDDVRAIMSSRHGFEASVRAYRHHFDRWGVAKYNRKSRNRRRLSASESESSDKDTSESSSPTSPSAAHSPSALGATSPECPSSAAPFIQPLGNDDVASSSPPYHGVYWQSSASSPVEAASDTAEDLLDDWRVRQNYEECHGREWPPHSHAYDGRPRWSTLPEARRHAPMILASSHNDAVEHRGSAYGSWTWPGPGRMYGNGPHSQYCDPQLQATVK